MTKSYDSALIDLVRQAMPNLIAQQLTSIQPMSSSAGYSFISRRPFWTGCCETDTCVGVGGGAVAVDLPWLTGWAPERTTHQQEIIAWAVTHLRGSFTYQQHLDTTRIAAPDDENDSLDPTPWWRWTFADPDDAVHFKLRWVGASPP